MKILIIGGTNIDINAVSKNKIIPFDSNIGSVETSIGGVGKNIVENLSRLNLDVSFATVIGSDYYGKIAEEYLKELGIKLIVKRSQLNTPKYLAIFNNNKDLELGINDMKAIDELDIDFMKENINFGNYDLLVIDSNLSKDAIKYICDNVKIPIYAEAISVNKVTKFKDFLNKLTAIKCNKKEAIALVDNLESNAIEDILINIKNQGVKEVYLTDGSRGSYLMKENKIYHLPALKTEVLTTTGAGDAFYSGVIYAKAKGLDELKYGNALASITLKAKESNNKNLNINLLESVVKKYENRH